MSRVDVKVATTENEDVGGSELDVCGERGRERGQSRKGKENDSGSTRLTVDEIQIRAGDVHSCDEGLAWYVEQVRLLSVEASDEECWVDEPSKEKRRRG